MGGGGGELEGGMETGGQKEAVERGGRGRREAAGRPLKVTPEESDSSRLPSKLLLFIHIYPFLVHPAPGRYKYCE